jgi:hypothetical protein
MNLGDLVRINPLYSRDPYGDPKEWKLFDEPWDPFSFKRVGNHSHICTFKEYQVGTVLGVGEIPTGVGITNRFTRSRGSKGVLRVQTRVNWNHEMVG